MDPILRDDRRGEDHGGEEEGGRGEEEGREEEGREEEEEGRGGEEDHGGEEEDPSVVQGRDEAQSHVVRQAHSGRVALDHNGHGVLARVVHVQHKLHCQIRRYQRGPPRYHSHQSFLVVFRLQALRGGLHDFHEGSVRGEARLWGHRRMHCPRSREQMDPGVLEVPEARRIHARFQHDSDRAEGDGILAAQGWQ